MKRLLVIGFGDVAHRTAALLPERVEVRAVSRTHGMDLDRPESLLPLAGWADTLLYCAPPPNEGFTDPRTSSLLAALEAGGILPRRLVYISTSGVYGDCAGSRVSESRPRNAQTPRARRRVAAEDRLRRWATRYGVRLSILRAPGIYADTRLPIDRLKLGTPVLRAEDDVYTNHIHADDLARAAVAAVFRGLPNRAYNVTDDADLQMGGWFDAVADAYHLPRPPRVSWDEAETRIAPMLLSFMSESRRLANQRMKQELRVRLKYPTPQTLFAEIAPRALKRQLALPLGSGP